MVFLGVILSIFGLSLLGEGVSQIENRSLAPYPDFEVSKLADPAYYKAVNTYLKDHLAERAAFVEANTAVMILAFRQSPNPDVYLGSNGWLFAAHPEQCAGVPPNVTAERLIAIGKDLRASGRRLVVLVAPSKETVYPEHLGYFAPAWSRCVIQQTDELRNDLQRAKDIDVLDALGLLRALKRSPQEPLYFRTGSHWTEAFSPLVSRDLVDTLKPGLWQQTALRTVRTSMTVGDLSLMLGAPSFEAAKELEVRRNKIRTRLVEKGFCPLYGPGCLYRYHSVGPPGTLISDRTTVIHDSFVPPMLPPYFSDITFVAWSKDKAWDDMLAESIRRSRVVVIVSYEPYLADRMANLAAEGRLRPIFRPK